MPTPVACLTWLQGAECPPVAVRRTGPQWTRSVGHGGVALESDTRLRLTQTDDSRVDAWHRVLVGYASQVPSRMSVRPAISSACRHACMRTGRSTRNMYPELSR